jgi:hypothetical protein
MQTGMPRPTAQRGDRTEAMSITHCQSWPIPASPCRVYHAADVGGPGTEPGSRKYWKQHMGVTMPTTGDEDRQWQTEEDRA